MKLAVAAQRDVLALRMDNVEAVAIQEREEDLVGGTTRHLLLVTATPHGGKEEVFSSFPAK